MGRVAIGENAVICAGSMVTKDVEANRLAVGNPARVIKRLTKDSSTESTMRERME